MLQDRVAHEEGEHRRLEQDITQLEAEEAKLLADLQHIKA